MYTYEVDAKYIGAVIHTGSTDWTDFSSDGFSDQTVSDGAGGLEPVPSGRDFSWLQIDASDSTTEVFFKLSPRDGAGDNTAPAMRIPAGAVVTRGLRGLVVSGVPTISIKLTTATDQIYITANFDTQG